MLHRTFPDLTNLHLSFDDSEQATREVDSQVQTAVELSHLTSLTLAGGLRHGFRLFRRLRVPLLDKLGCYNVNGRTPWVELVSMLSKSHSSVTKLSYQSDDALDSGIEVLLNALPAVVHVKVDAQFAAATLLPLLMERVLPSTLARNVDTEHDSPMTAHSSYLCPSIELLEYSKLDSVVSSKTIVNFLLLPRCQPRTNDKDSGCCKGKEHGHTCVVRLRRLVLHVSSSCKQEVLNHPAVKNLLDNGFDLSLV